MGPQMERLINYCRVGSVNGGLSPMDSRKALQLHMNDLIPGFGPGALLEAQLLADDRAIRIGAIQRLDYHEAIVLTHDKWKSDSGGIPQFSFLLATARDGNNPDAADDDEVLLLRVEGTAPLSMESDLHAVREEALRDALSRASDPSPAVVLDLDIDPFTRNRASFTGLRCRIVGTFYEETIEGNTVLQFGSDVDNFYATSSYRVLKPVGEGLSTIVSYTRQGVGVVDPVTIGDVRYSATRRRSMVSGQAAAPVRVNMNDFIGHKTGLLGMTRSGKSNTAKILVARTFIASQRRVNAGEPPIGQLIFDPQGEYANTNVQDGTAIADIGGDFVRIFKFGPSTEAHVRPLGINFYDAAQIDIVQIFIDSEMKNSGVGYVSDFASVNFADDLNDRSQSAKASRGRLLLYASLYKANFTPPASGVEIKFSMKKDARDWVIGQLGRNPFRDLGGGGYVAVSLADAADIVDVVLAGKSAGEQLMVDFSDSDHWNSTEPIYSGKTSTKGHSRGYRNLLPLRDYHDPNTKRDVSKEIYEDLLAGRIVIVDLHVGTTTVIQKLSEMITAHVLSTHMRTFTSGATPPPIQVMLEEAHNLFSAQKYDKDADVWIRLAKEAAKLNIGMIYATQEVSGVAHQVKSNTANWVVSHLNNRSELNELSKFYDFKAFADAILASEDRGYVRLKTLSSPFIIPAQIEKYDASLVNEARESAGLPALA